MIIQSFVPVVCWQIHAVPAKFSPFVGRCCPVCAPSRTEQSCVLHPFAGVGRSIAEEKYCRSMVHVEALSYRLVLRWLGSHQPGLGDQKTVPGGMKSCPLIGVPARCTRTSESANTVRVRSIPLLRSARGAWRLFCLILSLGSLPGRESGLSSNIWHPNVRSGLEGASRRVELRYLSKDTSMYRMRCPNCQQKELLRSSMLLYWKVFPLFSFVIWSDITVNRRSSYCSFDSGSRLSFPKKSRDLVAENRYDCLSWWVLVPFAAEDRALASMVYQLLAKLGQ